MNPDFKLDPDSRPQNSLLRFIETRAVDHGGLLAESLLSGDDNEMLAHWMMNGYISMGRVCSEDITRDSCRWVALSEQAWRDAHAIRLDRAAKSWRGRKWQSTDEKRKGAPMADPFAFTAEPEMFGCVWCHERHPVADENWPRYRCPACGAAHCEACTMTGECAVCGAHLMALPDYKLMPGDGYVEPAPDNENKETGQ